ncbi:hypothetical protein ACFP3Q_16945 [Nocardioides sp. GCM10027113]|uniref:hypothetical protein n=1 Tax=unclassified Nocardioides TaxID=2615069 RepID=UPI00361E4404
MSMHGGVGQPGAAPPLPTSIWVVVWASLAGQLVALGARGGRQDDAVSFVVSVVLGGLVVGYVSAGVVRARPVRVVLAWVVLGLALVAEVLGILSVGDAGQAAWLILSLATTAAALAGLAAFSSSDWYAWQRTRPAAREGAPIGSLVAIGVLVGVLGGLMGPVDANGIDVRISVADR